MPEPDAGGAEPELTAEEVALRRRRRRIAALAAGVVAVLGLLAVAVDVAAEYVPAVRAVLRARTDLEQAEGLLRTDVAHLDAARVAQAQQLLVDAQGELGSASDSLDGGLLVRVGAHLPWIGRQVDAARSLRRTAAAADRLGLDLLPLLSELLPRADDPQTTTLARLAAAAGDRRDVVAGLPGDVATLDAAASSIPDGGLLGPLGDARATVQRDVPAVVSAVGAAVPFLDAVPTAVGPGTHAYLVLVANPGEERPGGGFIGAIGEIDVRNGAVVGRTFRDSAFSDDLVRDIPPPRPLAGYLFHGLWWELSDAGWSPDFPTSAAQVATFYERATGVHADGEIEVDPVAFSSLLAVLGPVQVPPYPQVVTAANALREINFITNAARPGDPGKVFLPPFGQAVLDRVLHAPIGQMAQLAGGLGAAVAGKHLVLHFDNPALQSVVDANRAGGEMETPLSDAVLVADANLGAGKGDLFTTRHYDLTASVDAAGDVHDHLALTYTSPVLHDPAELSLVAGSGGIYKDYVRVYVPEPAHLDGMTLTGGGVTEPVSPEEVTHELGRLCVAFFLQVPPGQTVTLAVDYDGGFASGTDGYALGWQKQLGALPWPVTVTLRLPDGTTRTWSSQLDSDLRFAS